MEDMEKSRLESRADMAVAELLDIIDPRYARLDKMKCDEPTATVVLPSNDGDVEMVDEHVIEKVNRAFAMPAEWMGERDAILDPMVP